MNIELLILGLVVFVSVMIWFHNWNMAHVVRKKIIPKLEAEGLQFVRAERIGFLKTGDFIEPTFQFGVYSNDKNTIYRYIYYLDKSRKEKRTTVRIKIILFWSYRIDFCPELSVCSSVSRKWQGR